MADKDKEITSYNKEFMSFDFSDMSVEELERRFELATASSVGLDDFSCKAIFDCINYSNGCGRQYV